jgi:hypothetical protein
MPGDFSKHYAAAKNNADNKQEDDFPDHGYSGTAILCMTGPRAGWWLPLNYGRKARVPGHSIVLNHAELMRGAHETFYGGEWRAYSDVSEKQMMELADKAKAGAA